MGFCILRFRESLLNHKTVKGFVFFRFLFGGSLLVTKKECKSTYSFLLIKVFIGQNKGWPGCIFDVTLHF